MAKDRAHIWGLGTLFKRVAGKDYPATSKRQGIFYLYYWEQGKRKKRRLEIDGVPVTDLETAKAEQMRLRAPSLTGDRLTALRLVEAEIKDLERRQEVEIDMASPPLRLDAAWQAYQHSPSFPDCSVGTLVGYRAHYGAFRAFLAGAAPDAVYLRDVTDDHAAAFLRATITDRSPGTHNKRLTFLRSFFDALAKPGRISVNPFREIRPRRAKPNSRRALSMAELETIVERAAGDLRLLLVVGMMTGLRLGDCCTLRWEEINLSAGIIRRVPRKTARSHADPVVVGIPPALRSNLESAPPASRMGYVLPRFAEMYLDRDGTGRVTRIIQAHFVSCGISIHAAGTGMAYHYDGKRKVYDESTRAVVQVGFHSLRHTWVSLHAAAGTPQAVIQESAGHSNPAMTEHYTHISDDTARRAAAALPGIGMVGIDPAPLADIRAAIDDAVESMSESELRELHAAILSRR